MILILLPSPVVISWALVKSFFSADGRAKSWKRIALDRASLWAVSNMNRRQTRALFGETRETYDAYMKSQNLAPVVDELGEDARLLWIGPRTSGRVILYLHGGAFIFGTIGSTPNFWRHVQENLEKNGKPTSVALLNYTLVPDATFPTQLKQAVLAIQHLIDSGVKPDNLQLTGDSAGGLLIHQVLSHILHPVVGIPKLALSAPFAGAYMMSPWTSLIDDDTLHTNENRGDLLDVPTGLYWGSKVLEGTPPSALPYLNAISAPEDWFKGVDKLVKRIFISAGDAEVLRDAIIKYTKTVEKHHSDVTFFLDDHGIHDDPFLLFLVGEKNLGKLTPFIVDWFGQGFSS